MGALPGFLLRSPPTVARGATLAGARFGRKPIVLVGRCGRHSSPTSATRCQGFGQASAGTSGRPCRHRGASRQAAAPRQFRLELQWHVLAARPAPRHRASENQGSRARRTASTPVGSPHQRETILRFARRSSPVHPHRRFLEKERAGPDRLALRTPPAPQGVPNQRTPLTSRLPPRLPVCRVAGRRARQWRYLLGLQPRHRQCKRCGSRPQLAHLPEGRGRSGTASTAHRHVEQLPTHARARRHRRAAPKPPRNEACRGRLRGPPVAPPGGVPMRLRSLPVTRVGPRSPPSRDPR